MRKSKIGKRISVLFACSLILVMTFTIVADAYTVSEIKYSSDGVFYIFSECLLDLPEKGGYQTMEATANVGVTTGGKASAGALGGQARLYQASNKALRASSYMQYNTSSSSGMLVRSGTITNQNGDNANQYFYAESLANVKMWYGDFANLTSYRTPNCLMPYGSRTVTNVDYTEIDLETEYKVNANGQTYGSALSAGLIGYEPDLILCVNDEGIEGYVKSTDLMPEINTEEEAVAYMNNLVLLDNESVNIPIYDENATKVLGYFSLTGGMEEI